MDWHHVRLSVSSIGPAVLVGALLVLTACTGGREAAETGTQMTGEASYYAGKFVGRKTANGEIYNPEAMTAAHRTLPFGTVVRVTRTDQPDGRSVVVRINDRGPFVAGRIIDLSKAAARELGMIAEGVVPVRLEIVEQGSAEGDGETSGGRLAW